MNVLEETTQNLILGIKPNTFKLKNDCSLYLSKAATQLVLRHNLNRFLTRIIKHQSNDAIKRQVFQEWKLNHSVKDKVHLSIKDRYGEYLVFEGYDDNESQKVDITLWLLEGVVYDRKELIYNEQG